MRRLSAHRPIMIYGFVIMLTLALILTTFSSFALLRTARFGATDGMLGEVLDAADRARLAAAGEEIRRLILASLLSAFACAALLTFMVRRLLQASFSALAEVARNARLVDGPLLPSDAQDEIAEVARTFRRTVRELNDERERIIAQHRELERMQESLIRASKLASVGRLAAGIAHEIGNPLAAVNGYLALMRDGLSEEEQKDVLTRSITQTQRIHETIKKLLTYARQDGVKEPILPIHTHAIAENAVHLVRNHPAAKQVLISTDLALDSAPHGGSEDLREVPPDAVGHAGPLGQVLVNLLLNATQATQGVEGARVRIFRTTAEDKVEISVEDNGPGIAADKLEAIFDPFYTTKPPGEGTGLGLAISRTLMEAMGGELTVATAPGKGACFTARLRRVET